MRCENHMPINFELPIVSSETIENERLRNIEFLKREIPNDKILVLAVYPDTHSVDESKHKIILAYVRADATYMNRAVPQELKNSFSMAHTTQGPELVALAISLTGNPEFKPVDIVLSRGFDSERTIETSSGKWRGLGFGWFAIDIGFFEGHLLED